MDHNTSQRFWSKVSYDDPNGCHTWTAGSSGGVKGNRYATFYIGRTMHYSARLAYADQVSEIPDGYLVRQVCGNRMCVNPAHLEAVTHSDKSKKAPGGVGLLNRAKRRCPKGHEYTGRDSSGARRCAPCRREASTRASRKHRAGLSLT